MIKRILSTVVLWLVLIAVLWKLGRPAAVVIITVLALLTQHELYGMLERTGAKPFRKLGLSLGAGIILTPFIARTLLENPQLPAHLVTLLLAVAVIVCCIRILAEREPEQRVDTLAATIFGIFYVPFMFHFLVEIFYVGEKDITGLMLAVWLVAVTKFCDTGALLTGMAIGRTKMAPTISPKKTWEGAVGGVFVGSLVGTGLVFFLPQFYPAKFTPLFSAIAAVPIALLGILSDLVESMIKRRAEVKDSGTSVPGIGGAFDLMDSFILTAPAGFLIFAYLL